MNYIKNNGTSRAKIEFIVARNWKLTKLPRGNAWTMNQFLVFFVWNVTPNDMLHIFLICVSKTRKFARYEGYVCEYENRNWNFNYPVTQKLMTQRFGEVHSFVNNSPASVVRNHLRTFYCALVELGVAYMNCRRWKVANHSMDYNLRLSWREFVDDEDRCDRTIVVSQSHFANRLNSASNGRGRECQRSAFL